jgi:hypothetical protein
VKKSCLKAGFGDCLVDVLKISSSHSLVFTSSECCSHIWMKLIYITSIAFVYPSLFINKFI